jgi:hypothetical protein
LEDARQRQPPSQTQQDAGNRTAERETLVELRRDRDQYRARAQRTKAKYKALERKFQVLWANMETITRIGREATSAEETE